MFVVIFRARARALDAEYAAMAARLRELALKEFGCLDFCAVTEGDQEVALSYWPDEASIHAWKQHTDHLMAQQLGRALVCVVQCRGGGGATRLPARCLKSVADRSRIRRLHALPGLHAR